MNRINLSRFTADRKKNICVIGSGLVGSMLSIMLADRGLNVDIYDKRNDLREDNTESGRSIAMSLSHRGWLAIEQIGLKESIKNIVHPKYGRIVHHEDAHTYAQYYGKDRQAISTINRQTLNSMLINRAEKTGRVYFHFKHQLDFIDPDNGVVNFINFKTKSIVNRQYDHIIGTDGIFSKARECLKRLSDFRLDCKTLDYGYKELTIPPTQKDQWALQSNHVHCWPRQNLLIVALPNNDRAFNCLLIMPLRGQQQSFASIRDSRDLKKLFGEHFSDLLPHLPNLEVDYFSNPLSKIFTVKCYPWHYKDRILVLGDAAHAIAPFYAMGMNVGFEDCTIFNSLIDQYDMHWGKIFEHITKKRKPDTDAIADLSLENFKHINHSVAKDFHRKWKLERKIWELFPDLWTPLYVRIAFTSEPVTQAMEAGNWQQQIMDRIDGENDIEALIHSNKADKLISHYLKSTNVSVA